MVISYKDFVEIYESSIKKKIAGKNDERYRF